MLRKTNLLASLFVFFLSSNLNAQDQTLNFSIPTFDETLKYLNEQWIKKNSFRCLMHELYLDYADSLFEYDSKKNTLKRNIKFYLNLSNVMIITKLKIYINFF